MAWARGPLDWATAPLAGIRSEPEAPSCLAVSALDHSGALMLAHSAASARDQFSALVPPPPGPRRGLTKVGARWQPAAFPDWAAMGLRLSAPLLRPGGAIPLAQRKRRMGRREECFLAGQGFRVQRSAARGRSLQRARPRWLSQHSLPLGHRRQPRLGAEYRCWLGAAGRRAAASRSEPARDRRGE